MKYTTVVDEYQALSANLASQWMGAGHVLELVRSVSGDPQLNPRAAASKLGASKFDELFAQPENRDQLADEYRRLSMYLSSPTWFDRHCSEDQRLQILASHPIAYFCMEYGLTSWLPIYSGGLGILAGDIIKEASDMGLPMVGVGLFYRHGFPGQRLDENSYQQEVVPTLDPETMPVTRAQDEAGRDILISVPIGQKLVYACVWKLQVGRVSLYLLDTDVQENENSDDRAITAMLYGGDEETRVQQEIVLGIGGVRALRAIGIQPGIYSMNEGHAAFLGLELLGDALQTQNLDEALRTTRSQVNYTNHTVVPAGNDVFSNDLVVRYLGPFANDRGIGTETLLRLAKRDSAHSFSMADLAFHLSGMANAVSALHAEVIPQNWPGYPVEAVTNGVHVPTWLGPDIRALLDTYVPGWQSDEPMWENIRSIPNRELWNARNAQRRDLIAFANDSQDVAQLDPDVLTIVWARRFTEYKRAWLIASDLERLSSIMCQPGARIQLVIAGKAHPRDESGKRIMQDLLTRLRRDERISGSVAFVPDYNERVARYLTMGADVWLNTPRKPLEASGTSGMKSSNNGGLQLTIDDGWAAEVDWWGVGWGIPGTDDLADADRLYSYLESGIVPTFYRRDDTGVPHEWVEMMKSTMITTLRQYSARRMLLDYLQKLYLPLLASQRALSASTG